MTNKQRLKALKTLLRYKKNWTKDAFARDNRNKPCEPDSRKACSYCIYGGCERVGIENPAPLFEFLIRGIANFNDDPETRHKDVLQAIDKAIKVCKT